MPHAVMPNEPPHPIPIRLLRAAAVIAPPDCLMQKLPKSRPFYRFVRTLCRIRGLRHFCCLIRGSGYPYSIQRLDSKAVDLHGSKFTTKIVGETYDYSTLDGSVHRPFCPRVRDPYPCGPHRCSSCRSYLRGFDSNVGSVGGSCCCTYQRLCDDGSCHAPLYA
jgi:hypothetical protein